MKAREIIYTAAIGAICCGCGGAKIQVTPAGVTVESGHFDGLRFDRTKSPHHTTTSLDTTRAPKTN